MFWFCPSLEMGDSSKQKCLSSMFGSPVQICTVATATHYWVALGSESKPSEPSVLSLSLGPAPGPQVLSRNQSVLMLDMLELLVLVVVLIFLYFTGFKKVKYCVVIMFT